MNAFPIIGADELRTLEGFEDLILEVAAAMAMWAARFNQVITRSQTSRANGEVLAGTKSGRRSPPATGSARSRAGRGIVGAPWRWMERFHDGQPGDSS